MPVAIRPSGLGLLLTVTAMGSLMLLSGCAGGTARTAPPATTSASPSIAASPSPTSDAAPRTAPVASPTAVPSPSSTPVASPTVPATAAASPAPVAPSSMSPASAPPPGTSPASGSSIVPAAALTDLVVADGAPFSLADTNGTWRVVFFGYTHCPDVCPATIGTLMEVLAARPETHVIFVSIDPARDTPESLATWAKYLPEGLVGVTGSPSAIRHAADGFGVKYARLDTDSRAGYAMAHTADQFLVDPQGSLRQIFPFGTPADVILSDLERLEAEDQENT